MLDGKLRREIAGAQFGFLELGEWRIAGVPRQRIEERVVADARPPGKGQRFAQSFQQDRQVEIHGEFERGRLALDANAQDGVADALDALTMAPEDHMQSKDYLMMRSAYHRLVDVRSDDELRGVVDYLWTIALGMEDQGASLAAEQLRAAQEALRKALENNASDEEIAKLTQDLREAMQKFLQAFAQWIERNAPR